MGGFPLWSVGEPGTAELGRESEGLLNGKTNRPLPGVGLDEERSTSADGMEGCRSNSALSLALKSSSKDMMSPSADGRPNSATSAAVPDDMESGHAGPAVVSSSDGIRARSAVSTFRI